MSYTISNSMKLIKPITLEISEELWTAFKKTIPRTTRLNDAVVLLIKNDTEMSNENKEDWVEER